MFFAIALLIPAIRAMEDVGDAKMPENVDMRALDLVLTLNLMLSLEKHERHSDNLLIYEVQVDANLETLGAVQAELAQVDADIAQRYFGNPAMPAARLATA